MEAQSIADRRRLRTLLATQPDWTLPDFAGTIGRSLGWVKKWAKRLRAAAPNDDTVLQSRSRARTTPPPPLSRVVIDRILAIRDEPSQNLKRVPGPKAILYDLQQETTTTIVGERLPRSTRTIWRILRQHQRILGPPFRTRRPVECPEPLTSWQLDFKDASTVPADPQQTAAGRRGLEYTRCRHLHSARCASPRRFHYGDCDRSSCPDHPMGMGVAG
jgi:hypothetical protein